MNWGKAWNWIPGMIILGFGHTLLRQRELALWGYVINSCDELTGEWEGENPDWGRRMRGMEQR